MDEDRLSERLARANRASSLLQDELVQEAFTRLESEYVRFWRESKPHAVADREKIYVAINVVGKVREHFGRVMADGKQAQLQLQDLVRAQKQRAGQ